MVSDIFKKIQAQMGEAIYLGASLAIYDKGAWQEHYLGTIDGVSPTEPGLIYDLASVSKVVGVATVMIELLEKGELALDAPLQTYYPAFQNAQVTLRELLTHSSGIDPFIPNRDQLSRSELISAINGIEVAPEKNFLYTDINFILLGLMLEEFFGQDLDTIFEERIFSRLGMLETSFGPRHGAVPTLKGVTDGEVHDPKAKVLGRHTGSAGLFSTVADLQRFCDFYLATDFKLPLLKNYSRADKERSLGWDLAGDWLLHTGYTGTFIMLNLKSQQAVIFLTNRTYAYDDRAFWIEKRDELIEVFKETLL